MKTHDAVHARSIADPEGFWREQAVLVDWHAPFTRVLDYSRPSTNQRANGGRE